MAWRLLLIEEGGISLRSTLSGIPSLGADTRCERIEWHSLIPQKLRDDPVDLVLPVALHGLDRPLHLFRWMLDNPLHSPTLAILPGAADQELLCAAAKATTDFMTWPAQREELIQRVTRILGEARERQSVRDRLIDEKSLAALVGNDPAFLRVIAQIPLIARSNKPVLISGETGTGKELCARAIHCLSKRRDFPFLPVDCAAFPDHLFENEMFGHARGAFTDAHRDQKGLIALAEGGTLFLDEIDSLSPSAQAKMLRFLQERTYRPLGGNRFLRAEVNVLAATNRDLDQLVHQQIFRDDLFFRLNVLRLHMVPLRERRRDVGLLARHFLEALCAENGARKTLAAATVSKLSGMEWKGNVRELANVIQRAFVFAEGSQILPAHVQTTAAADSAPGEAESFRAARARTIEEFERQYVGETLRQHKGNVTQAARQAGKDRRAFGRLVKRYNIDRQLC
jgi:two-component system response regulator GlrR